MKALYMSRPKSSSTKLRSDFLNLQGAEVDGSLVKLSRSSPQQGRKRWAKFPKQFWTSTYTSIFFFSIFFFPLFADVGEIEMGSPSFIQPVADKEPRLIINNRPLAKINGKVISLYDVVKKMDLFLYDYYPNKTFSAVERYQYYMGRWEAILDEMVADELILMDAEQKEIKVTDGEVREELEERFGPTIMSNLDTVNFQYEEAREMIRNGIIVGRLIGMKVHSKAFQTTTPQTIKVAYEEYLENNPPEDEWKYQVLSIRGKDEKVCASLAEKAYAALHNEGKPFEKVAEILEEEEVTITLSDDYSGPTQKISSAHLKVLQELKEGTYSAPVPQVSRFDNSTVHRIFYLKEQIKNLPETFDKMHDKLKNELLFKVADKEKEVYIHTLKKRFGYDTHSPKFELPEDYRPFALL